MAKTVLSDRMAEMTTTRDQIGRRPVAAREAWRKPVQQFDSTATVEIVVPYSNQELTAKVVERAAALSAGLNVVLKLVAVYVAPYPAELRCPATMERYLATRLREVAERTSLPSCVQIVVSRDRVDGFRRLLRPGSTVFVGSLNRFWRTREEKLARELTRQGHHVSLMHFD
jgi:hypothetical protein